MWLTLHIQRGKTHLFATIQLSAWVSWLSRAGLVACAVSILVAVVSLGLQALPVVLTSALVGSACVWALRMAQRRATIVLSPIGLSMSGPRSGNVELPLNDVSRFQHVPFELSKSDGETHEGNFIKVFAPAKQFTYGHGVPDGRLYDLTVQLNELLADLRS